VPETSSELLIPGSITGALRELSMGSNPKATPKSAAAPTYMAIARLAETTGIEVDNPAQLAVVQAAREHGSHA